MLKELEPILHSLSGKWKELELIYNENFIMPRILGACKFCVILPGKHYEQRNLEGYSP